jgi:hypothetical protein
MQTASTWDKIRSSVLTPHEMLEREQASSNDVFNTLEEYLASGNYTDFYSPDSVDEEKYNNAIIDYDHFEDEVYIPIQYTDFSKIQQMTSGVIQYLQFTNIKQIGGVDAFIGQIELTTFSANILRVNLYGLLSNNTDNIGYGKIVEVLTKLQKLPQLTHLNIGNNNIVVKNSNISLAELILSFPKLTHLNISNNKVIEKTEWVKFLSPESKLISLNIANNLILDSKLNASEDMYNIRKRIQQVLQTSILQNNTRTYLNITNNGFDIPSIIQTIKQDPNAPNKKIVFDIRNLLLPSVLNVYRQKLIPSLQLSNIDMSQDNKMKTTDDYAININIQKYLADYLENDPLNILNNRPVVNYINALNDVNIGNNNLLVKKLSLTERKLKLIDIINYHQMIMGLSPNERKMLASNMSGYIIDALEVGNTDSSSLQLSNQGIGVSVQYGTEMETTQKEVGKSTPWDSYRIKKTDFSLPFQVLNTFIEKNDDSSFRFFERNQKLINDMTTKTNSIRLLREYIEHNSSIQEINVSYCNLNDNLFLKLYQSLKKVSNTSKLNRIELSNNNLTDKSCRYVAILLKLIPTLTYINISNNNITDYGYNLMSHEIIGLSNEKQISIVYGKSTSEDTINTGVYDSFTNFKNVIAAFPGEKADNIKTYNLQKLRVLQYQKIRIIIRRLNSLANAVSGVVHGIYTGVKDAVVDFGRSVVNKADMTRAYMGATKDMKELEKEDKLKLEKRMENFEKGKSDLEQKIEQLEKRNAELTKPKPRGLLGGIFGFKKSGGKNTKKRKRKRKITRKRNTNKPKQRKTRKHKHKITKQKRKLYITKNT